MLNSLDGTADKEVSKKMGIEDVPTKAEQDYIHAIKKSYKHSKGTREDGLIMPPTKQELLEFIAEERQILQSKGVSSLYYGQDKIVMIDPEIMEKIHNKAVKANKKFNNGIDDPEAFGSRKQIVHDRHTADDFEDYGGTLDGYLKLLNLNEEQIKAVRDELPKNASIQDLINFTEKHKDGVLDGISDDEQAVIDKRKAALRGELRVTEETGANGKVVNKSYGDNADMHVKEYKEIVEKLKEFYNKEHGTQTMTDEEFSNMVNKIKKNNEGQGKH